MAKFEQNDEVQGKCFSLKSSEKLGQKITRHVEDEHIVIVQSNKVAQVGYFHPEYLEHRTVLLDNVRLPNREIEEFEIY